MLAKLFPDKILAFTKELLFPSYLIGRYLLNLLTHYIFDANRFSSMAIAVPFN